MSRTAAEAFHQLADVEQKLDLLQYNDSGIAIWPVLRQRVFAQLLNLQMPARRVVGRGQRLLHALSDLRSLLSLPKTDYVIKSFVSNLVEEWDGKFHDIRFNGFMRDLGRIYKVETINNPSFIGRRAHADMPADMTSTFFDVGASVSARMRHSRDLDKLAAVVATQLRKAFQSDVFDEATIAHTLHYFRESRRLWRMALKRLAPKAVLMGDSNEYGTVAGARDLGIPVVEMQHGINDRYHAGYSWTRYALPYKNKMPVPDRLLLYGTHWRDELAAGGFWGDSLRVAGSPQIDRHRRLAGDRFASPRTVLFTGQGIDTSKVANFLREFLALTADQDIRLIVRRHPFYEVDKSWYTDAFAGYEARTNVLGGSDKPSTFELLRNSALHVSISSATHYDALGLGVPTAVLPFTMHDVVLPLCRAGHATLVETPADLARLVGDVDQLRVTDAVRTGYFAEHAVTNICHELEELTSERPVIERKSA